MSASTHGVTGKPSVAEAVDGADRVAYFERESGKSSGDSVSTVWRECAKNEGRFAQRAQKQGVRLLQRERQNDLGFGQRHPQGPFRHFARILPPS